MNDQTINSACQAEVHDEFSLHRSPVFLYGPSGLLPRLRRLSVPVISAGRYLRDRGLVFTLRKAVWFATSAVRQKSASSQVQVWKTPAIEGAVLNLQPGEWVQIKSLEEVMGTLDSQGKTHGLFFTNEMKLHCGRRYRVFKRVESIFNEFTKEQRTVRNTVLLETVFCQGEGLGCNRSCFHMWREAWLSRSDAPLPEGGKEQSAPSFTILNNSRRMNS